MTTPDPRASSSDHFRALFELASEGIWRCELDEPVSIHLSQDEQIAAFYRLGYFAECNPAMAAMYGVPDSSALLGTRLPDLLPPDDPHNIEYLRAFIRSGYRLRDAESHELDAAGRPKYFRNNLFGILEHDHLIRAWGTQRDITEQKEIERELRRKVDELETTTEALRDREALLRSLGDNVPGAIYQAIRPVGGPTTFRYFSAGIERLTGVRPEEIEADPANLYVLIPEADLPGLAAAEDASVRTGTAFAHQFRIGTRAGQLCWIHCRAASRTLADGSIVWDGLVMDITEQKAAAEALREADRRKDEFLAMLAHELRNPLAPIRTAVRILEIRKGDDPVAARNLGIIVRSVDTMARLLDDLLDVSRITRGLVELRPEPLDLVAALQQVVETNRPGIEAHQHSLVVRLPEGGLTISADPVRLEQIVTNLLTNAAKYTDPGGRITLALEVEDDDLAPVAVIRVRDTGRGIPAELLPRVFDLFTQGEQSLARTHGGLGIGLTMVRRLVEMHGGRVSARSDGPGHGAEFTVRLPIQNDERGTMNDESPTPEPMPQQDPEVQPHTPSLISHPSEGSDVHRSSLIVHRSKRVLVVDDNADAAETLAELFRLWECEVRTALDGPAALELAADFQPDLILLDIGMPQMDGYEVARRLRADPHLSAPRPHVIALTGYGREEDRAAALSAGFDTHLTKPVDPETLHTLVEQLGNAS